MIEKVSFWLAGFDSDGLRDRDIGTLEKGYTHKVTLSLLTGAGILIAGVGVLFYLMSMSHFSGLTAFFHLGSVSSHALWISGVAGMAGGGALAVSHSALIALKKNGERAHSKKMLIIIGPALNKANILFQ